MSRRSSGITPRTLVGALESGAERYAYRALRVDGTPEDGEFFAATREQATAHLAARGLFPVELKRREPDHAAPSHLGASDLATGLALLASLLESGLPMERALQVFADAAPTRWGMPRIAAIRDAVREGKPLATALASVPIGVPSFICGMIRAGEATGELARAVRHAAEVLEQSAATRAAIRSALAYPLVLACAGGASIALLVGVVLPRFAVIVEDLGQTLPWAARAILATADLARVAVLPVVAVLAVATVLLRRRLHSDETARRRWDALLLRLPGWGSLSRTAASARVNAALSALLRSGVPVPAALSYAAPATGNTVLAQRLMDVRQAVIGGERLSVAMAQADAVTISAVQFLRAGEATGEVAVMLGHAARIDRERAESWVKMAVRVLEPAMILLFGAIVALVAAALLQAVYSVRPVA